ncbi:hypothetical protein [Anatilimnocola floriformis]|uniref:hypothetical protein n=1 Tax=Anatilimnocola floriformis TaxID=2948575 RepID=UPI0020C3831B|nr:hypothetical protein [Anatilimnocola floriformis]
MAEDRKIEGQKPDSKPKKEKDILKPMHVSERDKRIFHEVRVDGRSQTEVGSKYGLTQPRVSKIITRVELWLSQPVAKDFAELPRADRLRAVSRLHKMRLDKMYEEALSAWEASRKPRTIRKTKMVKGESVPDPEVQSQNGDARLWKCVIIAMKELSAFEGFNGRGEVDASTAGRVWEPVLKDEAVNREVKRRTMLGMFDTPGDEGIPGAWGNEMAARNAQLAADGANQPDVGRATLPRSRAGEPADAGGANQSTANDDRAEEYQSACDHGSAGASPSLSEDCAEVCDPPVSGCYKRLYENGSESSQDVEQQCVTTKEKRDNLLYITGSIPGRATLPRSRAGEPAAASETNPSNENSNRAEGNQPASDHGSAGASPSREAPSRETPQGTPFRQFPSPEFMARNTGMPIVTVRQMTPPSKREFGMPYPSSPSETSG